MHVEYWRKSEVFNYTDNRKSIKDISKMFEEKTLIVDESYQRRSVWGEKRQSSIGGNCPFKLDYSSIVFFGKLIQMRKQESLLHIL